MKHPLLRVLIRALIFSLISGIIVFVIGLILKWKTFVQFSDGYFWAGAIFILIAFVNLWGMFSGRTVAGLQFSQSAVHLDASERFKIWDRDVLRGYNFLAFMGISCLMMFILAGLALLVGKLF